MSKRQLEIGEIPAFAGMEREAGMEEGAGIERGAGMEGKREWKERENGIFFAAGGENIFIMKKESCPKN